MTLYNIYLSKYTFSKVEDYVQNLHDSINKTNFESMRFEKINSSITTIRKLKIYFFIELLREVFCKPEKNNKN